MFIGRREGSITAYLTLIMFLVLALIATCIEAARVSAAQGYANRVLNTALRSTLGDYYMPLYDNYHLFGLDTGFGDKNIQEAELIERIQNTMEDSFEPKTNFLFLQQSADRNFLICNPKVDTIKIRERRTFLNNNGREFKNQTINYQKYSAAASLLEEFLGKCNLLTETEEINELLEDKLEVETQLYEIDKQMLKLVQYIDGFAIEDSGIRLDSKGNPGISDPFVKKLVNFTVSEDTVQINQPVLYKAIKDKYINPSACIDELIGLGKEAIHKKARVEELSAELEILLLDADYDDPEYVMQENSLKQWLFEAELEFGSCVSKINSLQNKLNQLPPLTLVSVEYALSCVDTILNTRESSRTGIEEYVDKVKASEEFLGEDYYEELLKEAEQMSSYSDESVSKLSIVYNITQMRETLINNRNLLTKIEKYQIPAYSPDITSYESWRATLLSLNTVFNDFSHEGLGIDYSSFNLTKESNGALSTFESLVNAGVAGLVIEDVEALSKGAVIEENLISTKQSIEKETSSMDMDELLSNTSNENETYDTTSSFEQAGLPIGDIIAEGSNTLIENILYIAYLEEHFSDYISKDATNEQVLSYELEYILYGNPTDKENIEAVVMRIVIVRAVVNLLHVLTDTEKGNTALIYATAIVGFTGLQFLISITKYIILFIWAFEAALVETAAIILGKEVPILTTKKNFTVQFSEILTMSKSNILRKAKNYESAKEGLRFGYKDYLRLFFLLQNKPKQYYRTMDLVQENIRYMYDSNFLLSRCVTDYEVRVNFYMPEMFLSMPFIKNSDMRSVKGYEFTLDAAVSY